MGGYQTPFFLFDLSKVKKRCEMLSNAFPGSSIFYAVKANNHTEILNALVEAGFGFDIGSKHEADLAMSFGAPPESIIFSAPVKLQSHIRDTFQKGVDLFVFDSEIELEKLALLARGSRVMARLAVSNDGSLFPLSSKFGCSPEEAAALMQRAVELGLVPYGLAFHVGSQCTRVRTWSEAIESAAGVWSELDGRGVRLQALNIGGGFPVPYLDPVPPIEEIAAEVLGLFNSDFPPGTELMLEPGRYLVAESAVLCSTVIGHARRGDDEWLFIDTSAFHSLLESLLVEGRFPYRVVTGHGGDAKKKYVLSGPTCDPEDTLTTEVWLPEVRVGDKLFILDTGAYSFVYASNFHGFAPPDIHFLLDGESRLESLWRESGEALAGPEQPEYGEDYRCVLEENEQVGKAYFNIREVPEPWIDALWEVYQQCMNLDDAPQGQSCYTPETFRDALKDSDYVNTVLTVDGEPLGLLLVTNNLEKASVAHLNPNFIRNLYPEEVAEGRFFYITTVFISPEVQRVGFLKLIGTAVFIGIRGWKEPVIGCDLSDNRSYLVDALIGIANANGRSIEKRLLGSQSFFALGMVPRQQQEEGSRRTVSSTRASE